MVLAFVDGTSFGTGTLAARRSARGSEEATGGGQHEEGRRREKRMRPGACAGGGATVPGYNGWIHQFDLTTTWGEHGALH